MADKFSILYVEDDPRDRELTLRQLKKQAPQLEITPAENQSAAEALLGRRSFDLALVDYKLPDGDGISLVSGIRDKGLACAAVVVTAHGDERKALASLKAGAEDYIVKRPDYLDELPEVIQAVLARFRARKGFRERPLRVLYAGGAEAEWNLTRDYFRRQAPHIRLEAVATGRACLVRLKKEAFDAVLIEYMLPDKSALELLKELGLLYPALPAFVMTARGEEDAAILSIKLGAGDYIVKEGEYLFRLVHALDRAIAQARLRKSERALRASEANYRTIFNAANDAILILDPETGAILDGNLKINEIYGYSPEEARHIDMATLSSGKPPYSRKEVRLWLKRAAQNNPQLFEWLARDKSGRHFWVEVNLKRTVIGGKDRLLAVVRDIDNRKKMEEELLKAKKLESIGILAGGMAHDYNNLLATIMGNIALGQLCSRPGHEVYQYLSDAEKASIQAKELTQELITFSEGGAPHKKPTSIARLVKDKIGSTLRDSNVKYEFSIPEGLWRVAIDKAQMGRVFHNMIVNAQDAMPAGGTIRVSAQNLKIGAENVHKLKEGKYIIISIEDHGSGIPEEFLEKIFDPFFSTKQRGIQKGMGLGLSICHSIIQKHEGNITVESEVNSGTTFHIYLPAFEEKVHEEKPAAEKPPAAGKRILVMDDEDMIRDLLAQTLNSLGYRVVLARDGAEAIGSYKQAMDSGKPFDAVILDLTVKVGMQGREAMQRLVEMDPAVKGIACSGYSIDSATADFKKYGFSGVLAKPFELKELGKTLSGVIKGEGRKGS